MDFLLVGCVSSCPNQECHSGRSIILCAMSYCNFLIEVSGYIIFVMMVLGNLLSSYQFRFILMHGMST